MHGTVLLEYPFCSDLAMRIHELNQRVQDIRREQAAQRVGYCGTDFLLIKC